MGRLGPGSGPGRLVEWLREGIRIATGPPDHDPDEEPVALAAPSPIAR